MYAGAGATRRSGRRHREPGPKRLAAGPSRASGGQQGGPWEEGQDFYIPDGRLWRNLASCARCAPLSIWLRAFP